MAKKKEEKEKRKKEMDGTEQKFKKPIKDKQGHSYTAMASNVPLKDTDQKFSGCISDKKTDKGNNILDGYLIDMLGNVIKIYAIG